MKPGPHRVARCSVVIVAAFLAACHPDLTGTTGGHPVATWEVSDRGLTPNDFNGVWARSASDAFAVGKAGAIAHFDGKSWTMMPVPDPTVTLNAVDGTSASDVYAVGYDPTYNARVLHFNGSAWSNVTTGLSFSALTGVWAESSNDVFVVGSRAIGHYDGHAWSAMSIPDSVPADAGFWRVWGTGPSDVYAVGSSGVIVHYDGTSWTLLEKQSPYPGGFDYRGVWASSPHDVFVVGDSGGVPLVVHYDGSSWTRQPLPADVPTLRLWAVTGSASNDVNVVATQYGGPVSYGASYILHYDGTSWMRTDSPAPASPLDAISTSGAATFAVGQSGIILANTGQNWAVQNGPGVPLVDAWVASANDVYVLASDGTLLESSSGGGAPWRWSYVQPAANPLAMQRFWGATFPSLWATSRACALNGCSYEYGGLYHFDGTTWVPESFPGVPQPFADVWGAAANDVFAAGPGPIFHFDGTTWAQMPTGASAAMHGLWGSSSNDVFAVGDSGIVLHFDGSTWKVMPTGETSPLRRVWGSSPSDVFAVGDNSIMHFDGSAWSKVKSTAARITAVAGSGASDVYVAGDHFLLHFDGHAWSPVDLPVSEYWLGLRVGGAGDIYLVGEDRTIVHGKPVK